MLWCRSYLVWLIFEGAITIHALVFIQKPVCLLVAAGVLYTSFFVCFVLFELFFRNGDIRQVGKEGKGKMRGL